MASPSENLREPLLSERGECAVQAPRPLRHKRGSARQRIHAAKVPAEAARREEGPMGKRAHRGTDPDAQLRGPKAPRRTVRGVVGKDAARDDQRRLGAVGGSPRALLHARGLRVPSRVVVPVEVVRCPRQAIEPCGRDRWRDRWGREQRGGQGPEGRRRYNQGYCADSDGRRRGRGVKAAGQPSPTLPAHVNGPREGETRTPGTPTPQTIAKGASIVVATGFR